MEIAATLYNLFLAVLLPPLILLFLFLLYLHAHQRSLLYLPHHPPSSRTHVPTPDAYGMARYDVVDMRANDGVAVRGFLIWGEDEQVGWARDRPTVVVFHANAGNMGHRLPMVRKLKNYLRCNFFLLSYRGYGPSDGTPSEPGIKRDVDAMMATLVAHPDVDESRLVAFGQSLGGAVAVYAVVKYPHRFCALMLENTFTSVPDLLPSIYPFLRFLAPFVRDPWRTSRIIPFIPSTTPILFLSSALDELVPQSHMKTLYNLSLLSSAGHKGNRMWVEFERAMHNDVFLQKGFAEQVKAFWDEFVAPQVGKSYDGKQPQHGVEGIGNRDPQRLYPHSHFVCKDHLAKIMCIQCATQSNN